MSNLLTLDEAYNQRSNPRWRGRPVGSRVWLRRDSEDDSFYFYQSSGGQICNVHTGDVWEFRLAPEPREWWEVRIGRADSVEAFFCDEDAARRYIAAERKAGVKYSDSYIAIHCTEVLADG